MEIAGRTIYGEKRFKEEVNENCTIYGTILQTEKDINVEFVVGLPGADRVSKKISNDYRKGIEGLITAGIGEHASMVLVEFDDEEITAFADFYTETGELIKKMVCNQKYYMFDGKAYYEVKSDASMPGQSSHETFIGKDPEHEFISDLISKKEEFAKIFLKIFESIG